MATSQARIRSKEELFKEARAFQERIQKSAGITPATSAVPEKDPTEHGQVSAPSHPDGDNPKKLLVPANSRPINDKEAPDGVSTQNPGPSGTDPVFATSGDAIDANCTSPTSPIEKGASPVKAIKEEAGQILQKLAGYAKTLAPNSPNAKAAAAAANTTTADAAIGDMHMKIAAALLSTDRGVALVEDYLAELRGVQDAQAILVKAASDQATYQQLAAEVAQASAAHEAAFYEGLQELDAQLKSASPTTRARIEKMARIHASNLSQLHPDLHAYYKAGAADAMAGLDAMGQGGEFEVPGGEGDLSPDQLLMLIDQLVQAGQLDPAVAEQLLAQLAGGVSTPEGHAEGGPATAGGEEGMPPEMKAASLAARLLQLS